MWTEALLIMLATFKWNASAFNYEANDDTAHGLRISLNKNFTIAAFNGFHKYILRFISQSSDKECEINYLYKDFFVYSLTALKMKSDSTIFSFLQVGENTTSNEVIFSVVTSNINI